MLANWDKSFNWMIISEGGFQNDPNDIGNHMRDGRAGSTMLGVCQQVWEDYVGHQVTQEDMKALTPAIVQPFYKKRYWDAGQCDNLSSGLDYAVFDLCVNSGIGRAGRILQTIVGSPVDGQIGPHTLDLVSKFDQKDLITKFCNARTDYLKGLHNPRYEAGWVHRSELVLQRALEMANG